MPAASVACVLIVTVSILTLAVRLQASAAAGHVVLRQQ